VDPQAIASVAEIGDGNLNLVFIVRDRHQHSLVLKQALPYVRLVGPNWPLAVDRAGREAEALRTYAELAPDLVPKLYHFDAVHCVVGMEDLSDHQVWRGALSAGERHEGTAADLGLFVARVAFYTSVFGLGGPEQRERLARAVNSEMRVITEDLIFSEPYVDSGRNSVLQENLVDVQALANDRAMLREIGALKWQFMTEAEALIHGDLHTGSVMVRAPSTEGPRSTKVIDPEFAFYGPVGFDIGILWANYVLASARAVSFGDSTHADWCLQLIGETWDAFVEEFCRLWPELHDNRVFRTWSRDQYLEKVKVDSWGFAAAEAVRRIVGLAKVADIESLDEHRRVGAARGVLRAARMMAVIRHLWPDIDAVKEMIANVLVECATTDV
jgi:5-methylthioribose kinase